MKTEKVEGWGVLLGEMNKKTKRVLGIFITTVICQITGFLPDVFFEKVADDIDGNPTTKLVVRYREGDKLLDIEQSKGEANIKGSGLANLSGECRLLYPVALSQDDLECDVADGGYERQSKSYNRAMGV